jgi:transposase InsO family protein
VSNELKKQGIFVSPGGIRSIWLRHHLETFRKRLKALETKMAQDNLILSEEQLRALEKSKADKEAFGEIETHHPGYLGAQDTYYVGTLKGVGRIYQQTFIDTYAKVAFVKLYDRKNALVAAEFLNDRVIPWYEEQGVRLLRILTDRGTEYCGNREHHEYQLYLAIEDIDHSKTKARSPQTNGICERFHRTIQNEFYAVAFRKKIYRSIEELQVDVDLWVKDYNEERTHTGKYCFGKTPMQTFIDSTPLAAEKMLDNLHPSFNNAFVF